MGAQGLPQKFVMTKFEAGAIFDGDTVYLTAHTGRRLSVRGDAVKFSAQRFGVEEALILQRFPPGSPHEPLRAGETVFLKADTGKYIEVDPGGKCRARFDTPTGYNAFVVEK